MDGLYLPNQTTKVWNVNGNGNWAVNANWTPQDYPGGVGDVATIDETAGTAVKTITVNQNIALAILNLANISNANTVANSAGIIIVFKTLDGSNAQLNLTNGGQKLFNANFRIDNTLTINSTFACAMSSIISGTSGFEKTGAGSLSPSGVNTFVGDVKITAGSLIISSNDNRLGNSSNQIIMNGGTLTINISTARNIVMQANSIFSITSATITFSGIISGNGNFSFQGTSGLLTLSGSNTFTGSITISTNQTLIVSADNNLGNSANSVNISSGGILKVTSSFSTSRNLIMSGIIFVDSGATFTLNGPITGLNAWIKSGSGTLVIASTYAGTVQLTVNSTNGSNGITQINGNFTNAGGTLSIQNAANVECNSSIKNITFAANAVSWMAAGSAGAVGTCTCTGLTMQSTTNVENKLRIYSSAASVSKFVVNGNVTLNGQLELTSSSLNTGTYDIITWTGTLTNTSFTLGTNNTGKSIAINVDTVNKKVQIIVT